MLAPMTPPPMMTTSAVRAMAGSLSRSRSSDGVSLHLPEQVGPSRPELQRRLRREPGSARGIWAMVEWPVGNQMSGALDGLVVLDLATFIAAPFCCTLLGEHGAEVIKVEQPGIGDDLRRLGHKAADGMSYMWLVESRNKKSITCNLRAPGGQALIARLAAQADILAENFRPGTME